MKIAANTDTVWVPFGILKTFKDDNAFFTLVSETGKKSRISKKFRSHYEDVKRRFDSLKGKNIEVLTRKTTTSNGRVKAWTPGSWFTDVRVAAPVGQTHSNDSAEWFSDMVGGTEFMSDSEKDASGIY